MWGKAAATVATAAAEAAKMAALEERCDSGEDTACDALSKEEEAKKRWLARLDVPTWGQAAAAVASVAADVTASAADLSPRLSEEEAKQRWLARLDAPTWGQAAAAVAIVAEEAAFSERLSEDEAKQRWLARLDAPIRPPRQ